MDQQFYHPTILLSLIPEELKNQIEDACDQLGDVYNYKTPCNPLPLNFEHNPMLKLAYIYRYYAIHGVAVRQCWTMLMETADLGFKDFVREKSEMNVFCVGGGPGTDLVGFCQFLDNCKIQIKLNPTILDYHNWSTEAKKVMSNIRGSDAYGIANFKYIKYDLFESPLNGNVVEAIGKADVVTVVKFLSAVVGGAEGFFKFQALLQAMKMNSWLFFVDSGKISNGRMNSAARGAGLDLVSEVSDWIVLSASEKSLMEGAQLRTAPLQKTLVYSSLWIKRDITAQQKPSASSATHEVK